MTSIERIKRTAILWKKALAAADAPIQLTKLQQALAAGFGFQTFAALLIAGAAGDEHFEEDALDRLEAIVPPPFDRDIARTTMRSVFARMAGNPTYEEAA